MCNLESFHLNGIVFTIYTYLIFNVLFVMYNVVCICILVYSPPIKSLEP